MPIRTDVVDWAIWESDHGSWKPSAEEIQNIFTTAGLQAPSLTDAENSLRTRSSGIKMGGYVIHWCGIFACYVLKRWGGLDVKWRLGEGIKGSGVVRRSGDQNIRAGDVAWIRGAANSSGQYAWHHFIVTKVNYGTNKLESVDGNSTNNSIVWHSKSIRYSGNDAADKNIWGYYQLNA
ncbi:MAG: hypothetical protein ACRENP_25790 [Longimicrobiales bacterium]